MFRTGASFSEELVKISRRNFQDAPCRSAIFEDIKTMKMQKQPIVSSGSAIPKIGMLRMSRAEQVGHRPLSQNQINNKRGSVD